MASILKKLNVLWVQEKNSDILSFLSKKSRQANPLQVPQRGLYGERYQLTGHFHISLDIYLFISKALRKDRPSMFPKSGAPMETNTHSSGCSTYVADKLTLK
jgi:hypothetical protein